MSALWGIAVSKMGVHFSSASNEWATPDAFFKALDKHFHFTLDPCCTERTAKCGEYYTQEMDGLNKSWYSHTVFMNPPYGREIGKWVQKAYIAALNGATVVCLIPSRTDTAWWHDYCSKGIVVFLRGRIHFVRDDGLTAPAPFPSCLVCFSPGVVNGAMRAVNANLLQLFSEEYNKSRVDKKRKCARVKV